MPTGSESMQGARLEFVVRPIKGTVKRMKYKAPPSAEEVKANPKLKGDTANVPRLVTEDAGFMVFTPSGACYRLTQKELIRRGFDRPPNLLNREAAKDTKTPAGRFLLAIRVEDREKAYREMEDEIIKRCVGRTGSDMTGIVSDLDPNGTMREAA